MNPYILLIIATLLWGGNFVIGRAVTTDIQPITLAFFRWCTAFLVFLPISYKYIRKEWHLIKENFHIVIIMALTGVAAFNTLVYIGVHYTTSINASLMNSSTPIIIYILSFIFLKERLSKQQVIGTIFSISGVLFILSGGDIKTILSFQFNKGDLIVLIAVSCWAVYSLLVKQYASKLPSYSTFLVTIALGILMLLPFTLWEMTTSNTSTDWNVSTVSAILYVGVLASIVAFLSWNKGVIALGANQASIFLNFIPLFATLFAVIFIGETLHFAQILGGIAVIFGTIIANSKGAS